MKLAIDSQPLSTTAVARFALSAREERGDIFSIKAVLVLVLLPLLVLHVSHYRMGCLKSGWIGCAAQTASEG